jgi:hypothetical protein
MKDQRHPLDRISIYIAVIALILIALGFASCAKPEAPQPEKDWTAWDWSRCLPSAIGPVSDSSGYSHEDRCPGEKPSWAIYQQTGKITWTYEIDGPRRIVVDESGEDWLVYDRLHCINAAGQRVGLLRNTGFKSISYRPHPLTGALWTGDDEGPTSGQFTIYGVIGPDGQVAPQSW